MKEKWILVAFGVVLGVTATIAFRPVPTPEPVATIQKNWDMYCPIDNIKGSKHLMEHSLERDDYLIYGFYHDKNGNAHYYHIRTDTIRIVDTTWIDVGKSPGVIYQNRKIDTVTADSVDGSLSDKLIDSLSKIMIMEALNDMWDDDTIRN